MFPVSSLSVVFLALSVGAELPAKSTEPVELTPCWSLVQIGLLEQKQRFTDPMKAAHANGKFTLQANSGMLFFKGQGTPDGIGFVYQTLEGDGAITAKVTKFSQFSHWGGAGVILRADRDPLGNYACAMLEDKSTPHTETDPKAERVQNASMRFRREVSNIGLGSLKTDPVTLPVWLRVERKGKQFTTSYSPDGKEWKAIKAVEIDAGPKMLAGITAWNRAGKTVIGTAEFEDIQVKSSSQ